MDSDQAPERGSGKSAASMIGPVLRDIRETAFKLSLDARDYFGTHWPPDPRLTPLDDRMVMNREMLFISARLSQVVLWALTQDGGANQEATEPGQEPAADAAETSETIAPAQATDGGDDAPSEPWAVDPLLLSPADNIGGRISYHPRFQALREGSLALYERVSRLHEQSIGADPTPESG